MSAGMSANNHPPDPKKLPVPLKGNTVLDTHQATEWASGTRGGGKLPADFEWRTNPKQHQEEYGSSEVEPLDPK